MWCSFGNPYLGQKWTRATEFVAFVGNDGVDAEGFTRGIRKSAAGVKNGLEGIEFLENNKVEWNFWD